MKKETWCIEVKCGEIWREVMFNLSKSEAEEYLPQFTEAFQGDTFRSAKQF